MCIVLLSSICYESMELNEIENEDGGCRRVKFTCWLLVVGSPALF
jgi:hypothetical protein